MSLQSRSGGGGRIHTSGYEGLQFAAGFLVAVGAGGRVVGGRVLVSVAFSTFVGEDLLVGVNVIVAV
jgi:hypothetical protein